MRRPDSMRVLHVLGSAEPGGTESLCVDLVRELDPAWVHSEVLFAGAKPGSVKDEVVAMPGVCVYTLAASTHLPGRFSLLLGLLCRQRSIDAIILYAHGLRAKVAMGAYLGGVRTVVALIGNPPPRQWWPRLKMRAYVRLTRRVVRHNVACSQYVAEQYRSLCRLSSSELGVIWNWCSAADGDRTDGPAVPQCTGEGPVFGMVSRLDAIKDHLTAIRAFARVIAELPAAQMLLVGDGPMRSRLEQEAERLCLGRAVRFLGAMPRSEVGRQLANIDVFVFSTTANEGFGIVLIEAMAAGVPIVATDIGPIREVLDDGRAGTLVAPKDADALASAMVGLWRDEDARKRQVSAGLELVQQRYSAKVAARKFEEILAGPQQRDPAPIVP